VHTPSRLNDGAVFGEGDFEPCHAGLAANLPFAAWTSSVSSVSSCLRPPLACHYSSAKWGLVGSVDPTQPVRVSSLLEMSRG
jgi:hypothetical protein